MKTAARLLAAGILFGLAGVLCHAGSPAAVPASMPAPVMGTLVKVDGNSLIVSIAQNGGKPREATIPTDSRTVFSVDWEPGKLADLKPEMKVTIVTTPATGARPARLTVAAASKGLTGRVVRVEGRNVVLSVRPPGGEPKEVAVGTNEKTKVFCFGVENAAGKAGKLEDLKADMTVTVVPETGTAAKIIAMPDRTVGRPTNTPASMPISAPIRVSRPEMADKF
jgi:hypothetical protein